MLFCYLFAIAGIDVHHCDESKKYYLTLPIIGTSCEYIHPEEKCSEECCGDEDDCCSDDILRISLSGDNLRSSANVPVFLQMTAKIIMDGAGILPVSPNSFRGIRAITAPPDNIIDKYCVLRV